MLLSFIAHTWWGALLFVIVCGHVTIMCTSLYLHRSITHDGVKFHPVISMAMRVWLWMFTAMGTKHWVAVHRKHHAFTDVEEDPHSPVVHGWKQIVFFGVKYYRNAYRDKDAMAQYTIGCPNDWVERRIFEPLKDVGLLLLLGIDILLFGFIAGTLVWGGQVLWVPFWAAGVVNGLGHTIGYRNYSVSDASRNIVPFGLLLSGEELHNNHHKFPSSAKFSKRWFELDMGWIYIQALRAFGLARVKVVQTGRIDFKVRARLAADHARVAAEHAREVALDTVHTATQAAKDIAHAKEPAVAGGLP
jgi:stearoyl-CoA desaturase (delta-9 desaturase)